MVEIWRRWKMTIEGYRIQNCFFLLFELPFSGKFWKFWKFHEFFKNVQIDK